MPSEDVIARLVVDGESQFSSAMNRARGATDDVGEGSAQAGEGAKKGAGGLLKAAAAAAVLYKGYKGLKSAVNTTSQLAKDTAGFARASGLSRKESQAWVLVSQQRGIQTKQLQVGMATLGRNLGALGAPTKSSAAMFEKLGVSQERLLEMPMEGRMAAISDAFSKLPDGANKAALAQRLFGRSGQQLLPILNEGGAAMTEQLDAANKLVPPLGKTGKAALDMAKQQRSMQMAMTGVKVAVGSALVPILAKLAGVTAPIVGKFTVLLNKCPALTAAILAVTGALVAMMVVNKLNALIATFSKVTLVQAAGSKIAAAAQWLWNASLLGFPLILVIAAIVAFGVALVVAYKKVGWFRDLVDAAFGAIKGAAVGAFNWIRNAASNVFNWIKSNWPLLLAVIAGPFGLAVGLVIKNFGAIRRAVGAAKDFVVARLGDIVGSVRGVPGKIAAAASGMFNPIKSAITGAVSWVRDKLQSIIGLVTKVINEIKSIPAKVGGAISDAAGSVTSAPGKLLGAINPFATGGIVAAATGLNARRRTTAMVGERGPEFATFPAGTRITPLPPPQLAASQLGGGDGRPVIAQVFLEKRMIAEAMASHAADQQAAR